jgi:hypothetical protein
MLGIKKRSRNDTLRYSCPGFMNEAIAKIKGTPKLRK